MTDTLNIMLVGVGGQGTLLAADVIALVGMEAGLDVKKSEVHGMAQRGGSVTSHVRWGETVSSPLIPLGSADFVVAFERIEALRHLQMLGPKGVVLVNEYGIVPVTVTSGGATYPSQEEETGVYDATGIEPVYVDAVCMAQNLGNARANNVVILGALSSYLDVPVETWLKVIAERVPARFVELNQQAFHAGRNAIKSA